MKNKIRNITKASNFIFKMFFKNVPLFLILYTLIKIITALIPALVIMLSKNIIDGLLSLYNDGNNSVLWIYIIVMFVIVVANSMFEDMGLILINFIRDKNDNFLSTIILDKLAKIKIKHFENKESLTKIETARNSQFYITGSFESVFDSLIIPIITFISTTSIVFIYYPLIAMIYLIATIPSAIISITQNEKMNNFSIDSIPETREKNYYYGILTQAHYAKELRLYNLSKPYKRKYNEILNKIISTREKIFRHGFVLLNFSTVISVTGYIAMYCYLIYKTYNGELSIGGLSAFTAAAFTIANNFSAIISGFMHHQNIFIKRILYFIDFLNWEEENHANTGILKEEKLQITFNNVTFKYPNTTNIILKNLTFTIKNGEKIALVGVNGAGKSTIIKLLLRFYEPDEGEILINGLNIKNYNMNSYRAKFSSCFQIVTNYALTLAENVALSDLERIGDENAIINSINASGLANIQETFEKGLYMPLTRYYEEDGAELSGGQWQKIAIARAFFKNAPFIILDEPSSALDPKAESQIFESFSALCGDKSGLLISHRLSSIMLVDKIIFIEDGQVKETGTHVELMKQNGAYAQMYKLQSEKYKIDKN